MGKKYVDWSLQVGKGCEDTCVSYKCSTKGGFRRESIEQSSK